MTDFNEIYSQYFKDVYKYVFSLCRNKAVSEEITQDTFFKALKRVDSFNGKCKIRVWLCQIAKNTYFSYCEKEKNHSQNAQPEEDAFGDDFEQKLISRESSFEIHKSLHRLDEPYKEVFTLRLFGELSFAQIAELFGKTESWARVTYHRARLKLKEDLQ